MNIITDWNRRNFTGFSRSTTNLIFSCRLIFSKENLQNAENIPRLRKVPSINLSNLFLVCSNGNINSFKKELLRHEREKHNSRKR